MVHPRGSRGSRIVKGRRVPTRTVGGRRVGTIRAPGVGIRGVQTFRVSGRGGQVITDGGPRFPTFEETRAGIFPSVGGQFIDEFGEPGFQQPFGGQQPGVDVDTIKRLINNRVSGLEQRVELLETHDVEFGQVATALGESIVGINNKLIEIDERTRGLDVGLITENLEKLGVAVTEKGGAEKVGILSQIGSLVGISGSVVLAGIGLILLGPPLIGLLVRRGKK